MPETLLTPSQEALIQRLSHNICYTEQLQLLCGEAGSGKSFLLRRLNRDIKRSQVVFISCPLHADDAEIRRKILLPLLSDPVFDDEESLADSLLNFAASLKQPLVILIDDAQRLSMPLWAELIALSQMIVAGRLVSIVVSVIPAFEQSILESLPEFYQPLLSSLYIESLNQQEQDALYYSLLRQSDGFENHLITKPDFRNGTVFPKDIVAIFVQPDDEPEKLIAEKMTMKNKVMLLLAMVAALTLVWSYWESLCAYFFYDEPVVTIEKEPQLINKSSLDLPVKDTAKIFKPVEAYEDVPALPEMKDKVQPVQEPTTTAETQVKITEPMPQQQKITATIENEVKEDDKLVEQATTQKIKIVRHVQAVNKVSDVSKTAPQASRAKQIASEPMNQKDKKPQISRPDPESYTLQIATVSKQRTLNNLIKQLGDHKGVRVGKYQSKWVVLLGEFDNYRQAKAYEAKLLLETKLPKPLIRKWKALKNIKLQSS